MQELGWLELAVGAETEAQAEDTRARRVTTAIINVNLLLRLWQHPFRK